MKEWYALQVFSNYEKRVKSILDEKSNSEDFGGAIAEAFLPVEKVIEVKRGKQRVREKSLWPGYLLVFMEMTDETWHFVRGINGVIGFLGGQKPIKLTKDEVENILGDLQSKKGQVTHKYNISVGDSVKVTEGPFVNFTAIVTDIAQVKGRLDVLVDIFGRKIPMSDLEFWQVEKVTGDEE